MTKHRSIADWMANPPGWLIALWALYIVVALLAVRGIAWVITRVVLHFT